MVPTTIRVGTPTSINFIYIISSSHAHRIVSMVIIHSFELIILTLTWGNKIQFSTVLAVGKSMVGAVSLPTF